MRDQTLEELAGELREAGRMFHFAAKNESDEAQKAEYKQGERVALRKYGEIMDDIKELEADFNANCYIK